MNEIIAIAESCVREAADDYVGLWQIAGRIRDRFSFSNNEEVKKISLEVVRLIVHRGLYPGDYFRMGFRFWSEDEPALVIARIDREWDAVCGDPTLADPICWFAAR